MKMLCGLIRLALLLAGLWAWAVSAAQAGGVYQYVFDQDTYALPPGETMDVPVYLQETVGAEDTPVLSPGGVGLITAGVRLLFNDPPQPSQPARVVNLFDIKENPDFDFPTSSLTATTAKLSLGTLLNPTVHGYEESPGVYRVLLGTFRFTAGEIEGQSTPIRATDYDPGFDDVVTGDMRVLDNSPLVDGMATITTVPEPTTLGLLACAAAVGMVLAIGRGKSCRG